MKGSLCVDYNHSMYSRLTNVLDKCKFSFFDKLYSVGDLCDIEK